MAEKFKYSELHNYDYTTHGCEVLASIEMLTFIKDSKLFGGKIMRKKDEIKLKVAEARPNDIGRGIVRIDPFIQNKMKLEIISAYRNK